MEKKYHFQGFRKFSIKTRLVIALLMISIIPLVGISGYSFHIFSAALQEKLSASISQTLSMINLNMVSEIEKYQYLCGSICISEEIKKGLLKKDMTDMEKNQAMLEIQNMIRNKIIYPAQAKNITVYDTDGKIFYDLGYDGFYQEDVDRILSQLEEQDQDVWAYAHTYRDRNILVLGRRIYEHFSKSRVIGYTLISIEEKIFSKTVLEPVGLSDSSNIMYMNLDGTVLSSWNRSIALGEKTGDELLKKIQERLPKKTSSFSIQEDGEGGDYFCQSSSRRSVVFFQIFRVDQTYSVNLFLSSKTVINTKCNIEVLRFYKHVKTLRIQIPLHCVSPFLILNFQHFAEHSRLDFSSNARKFFLYRLHKKFYTRWISQLFAFQFIDLFA